MPSSDLDDDDFFADLNFDDETFAQIDSVVQRATQVPRAPAPVPAAQTKPKVVAAYHHVVAQPRPSQSGPTSSRTNGPQAGPSRPIIPNRARPPPRQPAPLNTEPRAGTGGFGWEHNGKRQIDAARYVAQVDERQQYWGTGGHGTRTIREDEDEDMPEVKMNPNGTYGRVPTPDVVDKHAKPSIAPVARKKEDAASLAAGAEARKKALMETLQADQAGPHGTNGGPGPSTVRQMTKTTSGPLQQLQQPNSSQRFSNNRTMSRSISAGHHPVSKPLHQQGRPMSPQLPTIPDASSQTPPASQGSLARKAVLESDGLKMAKEAMERELANVKRQLAEERRKAEEMERKANEAASRDNGRVQQAAADQDSADWKKKYEEERNKVFTSEGAASVVRRKMQTMEAEFRSKLEKMQANLDDMALKAKEKERETARQLENVKTQAVFSNHAVLSSAIKRRSDASSQRPPGSPSKFVSPRGKAMEESFLQRTAVKGKGRAMPPPPDPIVIPQPKFTAFNNAFDSSPKVSRVKRQRTESVAPRQDSPSHSPSKQSPFASPRGRKVEDGPDPGSPTPGAAPEFAQMDDVVMEDIRAMTEATLDEVEDEPAIDARTALLGHMFNYSPLSRFQAAVDESTRSQPVLYRILNYRPPPALDREGKYGRYCAELLQACGDASIPCKRLGDTLSRCLVSCLAIVTEGLIAPDAPHFRLNEVMVCINILTLCARTTWLFRDFMENGLSGASIDTCMTLLVNHLYATDSARSTYQERFNDDIKAHIVSRQPPPPPPPALIQIHGTQRHMATQLRATQAVRQPPPPPPPEVLPTPAWSMWYEELAFALADMAQACCWFCPYWTGDTLAEICMGLTAKHLPLDIVMQGMGVVWAAATFKDNFRYLMMPSSTWPNAGTDPVIERLSRYLLAPPDGAKEEVHRFTVLILRSLTMMTIADASAILLVGQQSLVVPALVSILRQSAVKLWGVCAEDVDVKETMETTTHALYLFHHLLFPRYTQTTLDLSHLSPAHDHPNPLYANDGPDFVVPPGASSASQPRVVVDVDEKDARLQGINVADAVNLQGAKREFTGLGHEFIATLGSIAFGQVVEEGHGLDEGEMNALQDMATAVLGELINGPEEDAIYELYDDLEDIMEPDEDGVAEDEAALQDVIVIHDDSD